MTITTHRWDHTSILNKVLQALDLKELVLIEDICRLDETSLAVFRRNIMGPDELEKLAQEYFDNAKYLDAKPLYEELVRQVPGWEDGNGNYELGLCYEKLGMHPEALEQFRLASKMRPYDSFFLYKFAAAELAYGDSTSALAHYIDLYVLLQRESPGAFADEVSQTIEKLVLQLNVPREQVDQAINESNEKISKLRGG